MKNYYTFFIVVLLFIYKPALSQHVNSIEKAKYDTDITTLKFEVYDIELQKGLLAFKHIYKINEAIAEDGVTIYRKPYDCQYAGMQDYPNAGLIIGVYDLEANMQDDIFKVYPAATQKSDCIPYTESVERLNRAKKYTAHLAIDISKRLELHKAIFKEEKKTIYFADSDFRLKIIGKADMSTFDGGTGETEFTIFLNEKKLYKRRFRHNISMAGGASLKILGYYQKDDKIVFLEKYISQSGMAGYTYDEFYGFSPIFSLSKLK